MTPGSAVEFPFWLLIAAAIIAMLEERLRIHLHVSLVLGGFGWLREPTLSRHPTVPII